MGVIVGGVNGSCLRPPHMFFLVFTSITLLVLAAPLFAPSGSLVKLDGKVGTIDNGGEWDELDIFTGLIYRTGDYFCHQIEDRSYTINGNQLPICVRDLGLLLGFTMASLLSIWIDRRINWGLITVLVLPIIVDGGVQMVSDYQSLNSIRLVTGILGGSGALLGMIRIMQNWLEELQEK